MVAGSLAPPGKYHAVSGVVEPVSTVTELGHTKSRGAYATLAVHVYPPTHAHDTEPPPLGNVGSGEGATPSLQNADPDVPGHDATVEAYALAFEPQPALGSNKTAQMGFGPGLKPEAGGRRPVVQEYSGVIVRLTVVTGGYTVSTLS